MIRFACPHCSKTLQVKDEFAGKKGPCPRCKKLVVVPAQTISPAGPAADLESLALAELQDRSQAEAQTPVAIDFTCPFCEATVWAGAELAGKQTPCPECQRIIKVPLLERAGPRDWRRPDDAVMPSGVRREAAAPEGAWGTEPSTRLVSRQALMEAEVIPEERDPFLRRKLVLLGLPLPLPVLALAVGILVVAGLWILWSFLYTPREQRAFEVARSYLEGDKARLLTPEQQAELHRALAEYYYLTNQGPLGLQHLVRARQVAIADPLEKQAVLRELLRQQLVLRLHTEDQGFQEVRETLRLVEPEIVRADVARELARTVVPTGRAEEVASLRAILVGSSATNVMRSACLSILGQELAHAGQIEPARSLAEEAKKLYKPEDPFPRPLMTLLVMLNQSDKDLEQHKDKDALRAAQLEGQTRAAGRPPALQAFADIKGTPLQVDALLGCAAALIERASGPQPAENVRLLLAEADRLVQTLPTEPAVWRRQRLVALAVAIGDLAYARQLADAMPFGPAQSRAHGIVWRAEFQQQASQGSVDPAQAKPLDQPQSAAYAAALVTIARHNARHSPGDTWQWAQALEPESTRPFAAIGVALGMRDRER